MSREIKWSKLILTATAVTGVLATAALVYASGGGEAHAGHAVHDSLSPEKLKDFLLRVVNFTGLAIILVWTLKKPLVNGLNGRRHAIKEQFAELEARRREAEQTYREHEEKLSRIDEEIKTIIDAAVKQGEIEKQKIIAEAERAAEGIKRQAEMTIQQETAEAKRRLREVAANQAAVMAEEIIKNNLTEADQAGLVENYLEKVGS